MPLGIHKWGFFISYKWEASALMSIKLSTGVLSFLRWISMAQIIPQEKGIKSHRKYRTIKDED